MQKFTCRGLTCLSIALSVLAGVSCSPAAKKARHLARGDKYLAEGQYESAEIEYISVVRIDRENPVAYERLATIYFDQGRFGRALQCLRKCKVLDPKNPAVHVKLGQIDQVTGNFKEAREEAKITLDLDPKNAEALGLLAGTSVTTNEVEETRQRLQPLSNTAPGQLALGTLAFRAHDLKATTAAFQQAAALDPKSSSAAAALAELAWFQKDLKLADQWFKTSVDLAPARSGRRVQYAQFKIQTGDAAAGKEILSAMVKQTPDYLPAWTGLAELTLSEKKFDECDQAIDSLLKREPNYYDALMLRGRLLATKGDHLKAAAAFESIVASYPQSAFAYHQLALAQVAIKEPVKAMASLNQALALNPGLTDATVLLALLKLNTGESNGAITLLEPLVKIRPPIVKARELLADAYQEKGDRAAALKIYQELAADQPQNPHPVVMTGVILLQQNKRDEARQAFNHAHEIAPGYFPAVEQLIGLDYVDKQYDKARERVEEMIKLYPQQSELHFLLGKLHMAQHEVQPAEAELLKAIELKPEAEAAYLLLANLYIQTNRRPLALEKLQAAETKNPKDVQPFMLAGVLYSQETNYPAARESYEKLLTVNPRFYPALNDLAYLYAVHLGQVDKASELARRAREIAPTSPSVADTLGWVLCLKGQPAAALGFLEESAAKLPNEPDVLFHLGTAQYRAGQDAAARATFERVVQLNKPFDGLAEVNRCLAVLAIDVKTATAAERDDLEKKLVEHPDDPMIADRLAGIDLRDGAVDKAIGIYETAVHANPNNARALYSLAKIYAGRPADLARAFELAKAAYKNAPDDAPVARLLGRLTYQNGDYKWALSLLQEASRKLTGDAELLYDLAESSYSMGFVGDAEAEAQQALALGGAFSRTEAAKQFLDMLALAKAPANAVAAADQVKQVLEKTPDYVPALVVAAVISDQKPDAVQARQTYEKILNRYPNFSPAQKRLAILYMADPKENQRAFEMAMKARNAYPDDAELTRALGIITYRKGDYARSVELLSASSANPSPDAQVVYCIGMAQYHLKQPKQSQQSLKQALDLGLPSDLAGEAKRVLAELK